MNENAARQARMELLEELMKQYEPPLRYTGGNSEEIGRALALPVSTLGDVLVVHAPGGDVYLALGQAVATVSV